MDAKTAISKNVLEFVANRRVRAFAIGVLVLAILAILQVENLRRQEPMGELLAGADLCISDLQRMQIALSQSGLSEYEIQNNRLLVPLTKHTQYLRAIAEQNAIPEALRKSDDKNTPPSVNPFLSRSQQLAIERAEKKQQIRDMVLRLPFVEEAWFEMDKSESRSAFEPAKQSAVVSIRTRNSVLLSDQHVHTVKQMIGGAVTGLGSDNIVVIDLIAGFAHQGNLDPSTTQQVHFQRIAIEHQQFYESQIRKALSAYPGIKISVHVDVHPKPQENHVASITNSIPATIQPARIAQLPAAGANSFASIKQTLEPLDSAKPSTIELISHTEKDPSSERLDKQISVSIDVPQQLVHDLFGPPPSSSSIATGPADLQAKMANDVDAKFERLRAEIIQKVRPLLSDIETKTAAETPINVNLIRIPLPDSPQWMAQAQDIATQNWPSAAVLIVGLMLLSIVMRKPESFEQSANLAGTNANGDILSIQSNATDQSGSIENPEARLTKLIEKDPDAAARVIEAWIRDAA